MTIGKSSRKSSVRSSIRAPKFLDKSSGFYGRLDEPEAVEAGEDVRGKEVEERWSGTTEDGNREGGVVVSQSPSGAEEVEKAEGFDFSEGMMEDDGETLLQRKSSRRGSSRWRRSSRRKQKEGRAQEGSARDERPSLGAEIPPAPGSLEDKGAVIEVGKENENHFAAQEEVDRQVLIRDKKRGRNDEGPEERRMRMEQEEGMKMVKRSTVKNYRKVSETRQKSLLVEIFDVLLLLSGAHISINSTLTSPG